MSVERTDEELLQAWREGDAAAAGQLVERHYEAILSFFFSRLAPDHASDLAQQTFETLFARPDAFERRSSLRSFLFGIARWKLTAHRRRGSERGDLNTPFVESDASACTADSPSTQLNLRRHESIVVQALRRLPLDDQILLELKTYEGLSTSELAAVFEVPPGTIASRLRRARGRLTRVVTHLSASPDEASETLTRLDEHMRQLRATVTRELSHPGRA